MSELRSLAKVLGVGAALCLIWWANRTWSGQPVDWYWTSPIALGISLVAFFIEDHARRIADLKARIANLEKMTGHRNPYADEE